MKTSVPTILTLIMWAWVSLSQATICSEPRFLNFEGDRIDRLRLIQVNDNYEIDNFPSLSTAVKASEKELPTILVHSGDFLSPSQRIFDNGYTMVNFMNHIGEKSIIILGNHEGDIPADQFQKRMEESEHPWMSSNIEKLVTPPDHCLFEYTVVTMNNLPALGFIGVLTDDKSTYGPNAFGGAIIHDPIKSAYQMAEKIRNRFGADFPIIALTHLSWEEDEILARTGLFHAVLGGHIHEVVVKWIDEIPVTKCGENMEYFCTIDLTFSKPFPASTATATTTTGANHQALHPTILEDQIGNTTSSSGVVREDTNRMIESMHISINETSMFPPDALLAQLVEDITETQLEKMQSILFPIPRVTLSATTSTIATTASTTATTTGSTSDAAAMITEDTSSVGGSTSPQQEQDQGEDQNMSMTTLTTLTTIADEADNMTSSEDARRQRDKESKMSIEEGEIIASMMYVRWKESSLAKVLLHQLVEALDADVALISGGNLRANRHYREPYFSVYDLMATFPFPTSKPITISLPGYLIEQLIQQSRLGAALQPPQPRGSYLQADSGLHYDAAQQKILQIAHGHTPFHPQTVYKVVINCLILSGLDNHVPLLDYFDPDTRTQLTTECHSKPAFFDVLVQHIVVRKQFLQSIFHLHTTSTSSSGSSSSSSSSSSMGGWERLDRDKNHLIDEEELRLAYYERHGVYPTKYILNLFYDAIRQQQPQPPPQPQHPTHPSMSTTTTSSTSSSSSDSSPTVTSDSDSDISSSTTGASDVMASSNDPAPAPTLLIPPRGGLSTTTTTTGTATGTASENNHSSMYHHHHSTSSSGSMSGGGMFSAIPVLFASLFSPTTTITSSTIPL